MKMKQILPLFALAFIFLCCSDDDTDFIENVITTPSTPETQTCDPNLRPIVMVHGFLASGDTYELQFQRFESNGYCPENLFVLDWNTIGGEDASIALDILIDDVLASTGATRVDLAGHSAGSSASYEYLNDATRAAKVAHYIHLAGNPQAGAAGPSNEVPTMNIYSTDDLVVTGGDIPGAINVQQSGNDHYEVATSMASFTNMFTFFNNGTVPTTFDILPMDFIDISGRAVTFGENMPMVGATVNIYEVDDETGYRVNTSPDYVATTDANGYYGPVRTPSCITYEFEIINSGRTVHYFREAFVRSDQLVYLRTIPTAGIGALLLGSLPEDDNQTVLAFYNGSRAVITGRDTLTVADNVVSTPDFADAPNSTIAMFYYDGNDNQTTDLTDIGGTWSFVPTFLAAVDMFLPTSPEVSITLQLNQRKLVVPNLKSGMDGVIVAQFN